MEEERTNVKNKWKVFSILLLIICVLLTAALALSVYWIVRENNRSVTAMAKMRNDISTLKEETIPIETFKAHAAQYGAGIPFLQSFFDDVIVYKNDEGIVYEPIDDTLPKNSYDFSKLRYQDAMAVYDVDGVTAKTGIDVSKYQGNIDWNAVKKSGISYAFIRVGLRGYGTGEILQDEYCLKNLEGATKAGMDIGVYFFSQAISKAEAIEEAEFVLKQIEGYDISYPIVFDMEEIASDTSRTKDLTAAQITDITIAFCERIKQAGHTPMIYGNIDWMIEHIELERLTEYDKWFAQYFNKPFFPYEFQMWQYTNKGKVDGIKGEVDLNLCFADYNQ